MARPLVQFRIDELDRLLLEAASEYTHCKSWKIFLRQAGIDAAKQVLKNVVEADEYGKLAD